MTAAMLAAAATVHGERDDLAVMDADVAGEGVGGGSDGTAANNGVEAHNAF